MIAATRVFSSTPVIAAKRILQAGAIRCQHSVQLKKNPARVSRPHVLRAGCVILLVTSLLVANGTPAAAAGDKFHQSMVFGTKVRMSLTEEELTEMRRRSQEHIAQRKKAEPGCRITDQELLMLSREFLVNARRRIQAADVATLAELSRKAEKEVKEWFQAASSKDPEDIVRDLKVRYYCVYTDEELGLIARSPKCLAALHVGNVLTSVEVRKYASAR